MRIDSVNPAAINGLDEFWEALLGNGPATGDLDPTLAKTVRRLHALDNAPALDPAFVRRLESQFGTGIVSQKAVTMEPINSLSSPLPLPVVQERSSHRVWRPLEYVAAAVLLLATGLAAYGTWQLAGPSASPSTPASGGSGVSLYVSDPEGQCLQPLDAITLQDVSRESEQCVATATAIAGATRQPPVSYLASADGSTVVRVEYRIDVTNPPSEFTITVLDGRSGGVRTRFTHEGLYDGIYAEPLLSADGSRLLIPNEYFYAHIPGTEPEFAVYDTRDGHLVSTVRLFVGGQQFATDRFFVSSDGRRLYAFSIACMATDVVLPDTPFPPQTPPACVDSPLLDAYDLSTGELGGVLTLTALVQGRPFEPFQMPAAALSPDGRWMTFVQANGSTLTVVDTERMVIDRTYLLNDGGRELSPTPTLDPLEEFLNPPEVTGEAVFSPNAERLYVQWVRRDTNGLTVRVQTIDIAEKAITADVVIDQMEQSTVMVDQLESVLLPSPDGEHFYILSPVLPAGMNPNAPPELRPWMLRRLDADTLALEAERQFRGFRSVLIWAGD